MRQRICHKEHLILNKSLWRWPTNRGRVLAVVCCCPLRVYLALPPLVLNAASIRATAASKPSSRSWTRPKWPGYASAVMKAGGGGSGNGCFSAPEPCCWSFPVWAETWCCSWQACRMKGTTASLTVANLHERRRQPQPQSRRQNHRRRRPAVHSAVCVSRRHLWARERYASGPNERLCRMARNRLLLG